MVMQAWVRAMHASFGRCSQVRNLLLGVVMGGVLGIAPSMAISQRFSQEQVHLFEELRAIPTDLGRYQYLAKINAASGVGNIPRQLLAFVENELGLYNEAIRDFPLRVMPIDNLNVDKLREDWHASPALDNIAALARSRQILMINEAHHDAHTRLLTLELLPRLYQSGYRYIALEALASKPGAIVKRGYPIASDGSEYLSEPIYGEIVREAVRLGFTIVSYESQSRTPQERERQQAESIFRQVFAVDPAAKLIVHAGYAHVDKAAGRLGNVLPMATFLSTKAGTNPLVVDQTQFREQFPAGDAQYEQLVEKFRPKAPIVLKNDDGAVWSAAPQLYDITVILPATPGGGLKSGVVERSAIVTDTNRALPVLSPIVNASRPSWLGEAGRTGRVAIQSKLCRARIPCVVDAKYAGEPDIAISADRYAFVHDDMRAVLYLRPGSYNLIATDERGNELGRQKIEVK